MQKIKSYVLAVLATYVIAVFFVTQFNLQSIVELGHSVSLIDRIKATGHDWLSMLASYLPLLAIALLIAFLFTGMILARLISVSTILYALAGFVGVLACHLIMSSVFGLVPVAATRTAAGLITQGLAGAFGGMLYYRSAVRVV